MSAPNAGVLRALSLPFRPLEKVDEHKRSAAMRAIFFALIFVPTATLAQDATSAKRPSVGEKPLVQVKPSAPAGCKFVGTVRGTKLWAGECTGVELRTTTTKIGRASCRERV